MQLPYLGVEEVKDKVLLAKQLCAEFIATLLLVLIGCGSCLGGTTDGDQQAQFTRIALCFGVTVASLAQCVGHVSGCHVNPAVTVGLAAGAKIGILKSVLFMVVQCIGGIAGAGLLRGLVHDELRGASALGVTQLHQNISPAQGLGIELLITMVLVLTVYAAAADSHNSGNVKGSAPLAIGLSITTCHLFAIPLTGSSMNPARSLGPAVITGSFAAHWVYWAGPILGALAAATIYQLAFQASPQEKYRSVNTNA